MAPFSCLHLRNTYLDAQPIHTWHTAAITSLLEKTGYGVESATCDYGLVDASGDCGIGGEIVEEEIDIGE
ncbi:hypothetical protein TorRG33x02_159740, partial [Trema orientale]